MTIAIMDIETDGLTPTKIHVCCAKILGDSNVYDLMDEVSYKVFVETFKPTRFVFHNGLTFDVKWLNHFWDAGIDTNKVIDTLVVSKLVDYKAYNTHSLKEIGQSLGVFKGDFEGPWDQCTTEMVEYCRQDVNVTEAIFNKFKSYIYDPDWSRAMRTEHDMAIICDEMETNGFRLNVPEAEVTLQSIKEEMSELEAGFAMSFPPKLVEEKRLKYRTKKDGTLFSSVQNALDSYPKTEVEGDDLVCYNYKGFNPGSPKDRIDVLWDAGWKPTDKTKGYKKYEKENNPWYSKKHSPRS